MIMIARNAIFLPLLLLGVTAASPPAMPGVTRETLQSKDLPGTRLKTVMVRTVIARGSKVPPHTHPGLEVGYVLSGEATLTVRGQTPRALKAGDSFTTSEGTVHNLANRGAAPLAVLSTYIVDPSRPILSPAP